MQPSNATLVLLGLAFVFVVIIGALVYVWLGTRIAVKGGKVPVEKFGPTDLFVGGLLIACFVSLSINGFNAPPVAVHDSGLISSALVYYIILTLLCAFLHFRGIDVPGQFGLRAVKFGRIAGLALLLLFAALPMIYCANLIMQQVMQNVFKEQARTQELVKYFVDASQHKNYRAVFLTLFTGAVVAPVAEEFIFRGYIYGILKRYLGISLGVVLNAALFATVHLNAASLPGLFLLAVCFTMAYEFTGSILVNMCMHSLFNLSTFAILLCFSPSFPQ